MRPISCTHHFQTSFAIHRITNQGIEARWFSLESIFISFQVSQRSQLLLHYIFLHFTFFLMYTLIKSHISCALPYGSVEFIDIWRWVLYQMPISCWCKFMVSDVKPTSVGKFQFIYFFWSILGSIGFCLIIHYFMRWEKKHWWLPLFFMTLSLSHVIIVLASDDELINLTHKLFQSIPTRFPIWLMKLFCNTPLHSLFFWIIRENTVTTISVITQSRYVEGLAFLGTWNLWRAKRVANMIHYGYNIFPLYAQDITSTDGFKP